LAPNVTATPAYAAGHVVVGTLDGGLYCVSPVENRVQWRYAPDEAVTIRGSAAVTPEAVIYGDIAGAVRRLSMANGTVQWTFKAKGGGVESSPTIVGQRVFIGGNGGRLYCLDLADGKEIWSFDTGAGITATPAVADGRMVVGATDGPVYCFGAKAGRR
jgi:outer membrane protein assembly factor BamB